MCCHDTMFLQPPVAFRGVNIISQKEKLIQTIKNNPDDVSFEELHKYLTMHGATYREGKGSHRVYHLNGERLPIPRQKPLKGIYVKLAISLVEGE